MRLSLQACDYYKIVPQVLRTCVRGKGPWTFAQGPFPLTGSSRKRAMGHPLLSTHVPFIAASPGQTPSRMTPFGTVVIFKQSPL